VSSFTRSKFTEGSQNLKKVTWPWPRPLSGSFITRRILIAMNYPTKKKRSVSFTRSKVTEGVPKFKNLRMHSITWSISRGLWKPHIWNRRPHFAYSLYNFYGATMTIKGRLLLRVPIVKRFSAENFLSPLFCKNLTFGGHKKGFTVNFNTFN